MISRTATPDDQVHAALKASIEVETSRYLWIPDDAVTFAEVETPNGDHPYATSKSMTGALDILAAAMDRARETGERPDVDDDGNLIGKGEGP